MYDDLLESQRPSKLEWFVLNTLIPSLFVTSLMHAHAMWVTPKPKYPSEEKRCAGIPLDFVAPFRAVFPETFEARALKQPQTHP